MTLLRGIEDIDWSQWTHAYGPATDVPDLLLDLESTDSQEAAKHELWGNIWHQGTVYPATKHAIPWLIKLLAPESTADRVWILTYLSELAWGNSYMRQHAQYDDDGSEDYANRMAEEVSHVDAARQAVVDGLPVYAGLLEDDDPQIRAGTCTLIAMIPELLNRAREDESVWATFTKLMADPEVVVRAAAVMGLGWVREWELVSDVLEKALNDEHVAVRWASAWAHGFHSKLTQPTIQILLEAIEDPTPINDALDGLLKRGADAESAGPLLRAPEEFLDDVLTGLLKQLKAATDFDALNTTELLLVLCFRQDKAPADAAELTPSQALALKTIAESDNVWVFDGNMTNILWHWGLPQRRAELQAFLGE